ncbi:MAG: hypothetical protein KIT83_03055 [Bryobacterales bacterium]|nr:hypothetical protein [Bryobacterales bacterium]
MHLALRTQRSPEFQTALSRQREVSAGDSEALGAAQSLRQRNAAASGLPRSAPIESTKADESAKLDLSRAMSSDPAARDSSFGRNGSRPAAYQCDTGYLRETGNRNGPAETANSRKGSGGFSPGMGISMTTRNAVEVSSSAHVGMPVHAATSQEESAAEADLRSRLLAASGHGQGEGHGGCRLPHASSISPHGSASGTPVTVGQSLAGTTPVTGKATLPQNSPEPLLAGRSAEASSELAPATPSSPRSLFIRIPAESREDAVNLRFLQRGDHIDVRVSSPSEATAREMREHLPSLLSRLHQAGFATERVAPLDAPEGNPDAARRGDGSGSSRQHGNSQEGSGDQSAPQQGRREPQPEGAAPQRRVLAAEHFASLLERSQTATQAINDLNVSQQRES